ncbi:hypothetical protein JMJ35_007243 [Cladonia borealis]|uniref:Arb2 domain-containing protein n=1 Tax=Cladonia borealis TaxID=184061 RepID=A0AA39V3F7_9LECA|nr:hypothetical protein JMJ35_007243 [Cladonia borealis]
MFRRLSSSLPKDPEFPADLEKLGYYVNEKDQIRSTAHPDQEFNFFISKNERVCEVQREAMNTCIRSELSHRFRAAGLQTTRLPLNTEPTEPHVPILTSQNISTAKRIVLYLGEAIQDLGVFAYRIIGQESISAGSALDFTHDIQSSKDSADTAIVMANLGQLLWYRRGQRAVTMATWNGLPRKTGVGGPMRIDPLKNHIPANEDVKAHVKSVFEMVGKMARDNAVIDVIGIGDGAEEAVEYLDQNWVRWETQVRAICVGMAFVWTVGSLLNNEKFRDFWGRRARAYLTHHEPVDTPLHGRDQLGCNCFSSGEPTYTENIMPRAYKSMLAYFQLVNDVPGYYETEMAPQADDSNRYVTWQDGMQEEACPESPRAA